MKVTDEMAKKAVIAHLEAATEYLLAQDENSPKSWEDFSVEEQKSLQSFMRAALEAVFDHIGKDKQDNDGWIEYDGNINPLPRGTRIYAKLRSGFITEWGYASAYLIPNKGAENDIIAYRIIDEPKEEKTEEKCQCNPNYRRLKDYDYCGACDKRIDIDQEVKKKEPKKQTLLEFIAEKKKTKKTSEQLYAFNLISEYLEKYI